MNSIHKLQKVILGAFDKTHSELAIEQSLLHKYILSWVSSGNFSFNNLLN